MNKRGMSILICALLAMSLFVPAVATAQEEQTAILIYSVEDEKIIDSSGEYLITEGSTLQFYLDRRVSITYQYQEGHTPENKSQEIYHEVTRRSIQLEAEANTELRIETEDQERLIMNIVFVEDTIWERGKRIVEIDAFDAMITALAANLIIGAAVFTRYYKYRRRVL